MKRINIIALGIDSAALGLAHAAEEAGKTMREISDMIVPANRATSRMDYRYRVQREPEQWQGSGKRRKPRTR